MQIVNATAMPAAQLEAMVDFCNPGLRRPWRIAFYPAQAQAPDGLCDAHTSRVTVSVPGDPPPWSVYLARRAIKMRTALEACVFVLAHELRHCWQAEQGLRLRTEAKERDADAYAARVLRRWRHAARAGATATG